ncbi:hypothetical protein [Lichenicoccus sp.]|uniref:hypothetical protein n=1 Tax=Lichenicoccus sp. TaxID=2781899 RepID=UPI003D15177F
MIVRRWPKSSDSGAFVVRSTCITLIGAACVVFAAAAFADEPDTSGNLARQQLNRVISVLKLQPAAAGATCLQALTDMHTTEDQVKQLRTRAKDPDLALALDVLESDYENAHELCGADARRVCSGSEQAADLSSACSRMRAN